METTTTLTEKIVNGLRKSATELEKFRLQAALGKAEAKTLYEDSKKKLNRSLHYAKHRLDQKTRSWKADFEMLQLTLALGKAETADKFEEQRKKILKSLAKIEQAIHKNKTADEFYSKLHIEIEKFKVKLEILRLRYKLNRMEAQVDFEKNKKTFTEKLKDIKFRLLAKEKNAETRWEHFRDEISDAYSHLKKSFAKP